MAVHIELKIAVTNKQQREMLLAQLADTGICGFEEDAQWLKAFIPEADYEKTIFDEIIEQNGLSYSLSAIEDRNWNEEWESGFQPVVIDDFCAIRAAFHPAVTAVKHEIIITPKMSFGTGHHATTCMMVKAMAGIDFQGKQVFDFGTGTGVLAILAEKMGAGTVTAIDNDDWSIDNAKENFNSNNCHKVLLSKEENIIENVEYDVLLANINRNIILQNLASIKQHLAPDGVVLLSGLLTGDEPVILTEAHRQQLVLSHRLEMNGWICLLMVISK